MDASFQLRDIVQRMIQLIFMFSFLLDILSMLLWQEYCQYPFAAVFLGHTEIPGIGFYTCQGCCEAKLFEIHLTEFTIFHSLT